MKNLILLFARYGSFFVFVFLEILCLLLIINFNDGQKAIFAHSSNLLTGKIYSYKESWKSFFELDDINDKLNRKNALLVQQIIELQGYGEESYIPDSSKYQLIPAKVINQTNYLTHNHLTLNVGSDQGIERDMGVITEQGVIGIVRNTSKHYSHAISLLNADTRISAEVRGKNSFGNLVWNDRDIQRVTLEAVPKHQNVEIGDTIQTNGFSTIFPPEIIVGTIESFEIKDGSSTYTITVLLEEDFASLDYVYIIKNRFSKEQLSLENIE